MRSWILVVGVVAGMLASPARGQTSRVLVFGAEGNRLNAYDGRGPGPAAKQTVIPSHGDDPQNGRDINAQICFFPDGSRRFVAGEDTNQPNPPPGWGIFQLEGDRIGELSATQIGKLTPTYQPITDPATDVPDNYGCGFLSDGRIVTSDIGNNLPGFEGNGQLIVWFPPFDSFTVRYCKIDLDIATAGGIYVDDQDRVYVASNRPDTLPPVVSSGGIHRYTPPFPTSDDAAGGCGQVDGTGAPLADTYGPAGATNKAVFIPSDAFVTTPSAIVRSLAGTFYVSSVFSGTIAEYDANGLFVRTILTPPPGETPPFSTGTPFGVGLDSEGTLYYADLGIGTGPPPGPVDGEGSEFRIRFVGGNPQAPELRDDGLDFPEGIGVLEIPLGLLNVKAVNIRAQRTPGAANGSIRLRGDFPTPPAFSFPPAFTVRVRDAMALDRTMTFTNCSVRNGRVRCSQLTTDGQFRASLAPLRTTPGMRFRVSFSRLALDGPFAGPVEVRFNHGDVSREDTVSTCRQQGSGLMCREP